MYVDIINCCPQPTKKWRQVKVGDKNFHTHFARGSRTRVCPKAICWSITEIPLTCYYSSTYYQTSKSGKKKLCVLFLKLFAVPPQGLCFVRYDQSTGECSAELTRIMSLKDCCCSMSVAQGYGSSRESCEPCPRPNEGKHCDLICIGENLEFWFFFCLNKAQLNYLNCSSSQKVCGCQVVWEIRHSNITKLVFMIYLSWLLTTLCQFSECTLIVTECMEKSSYAF